MLQRSFHQAVESGHPGDIAAAREAFAAALEALLSSDRARLRHLDGRSEAMTERAFLRARASVLEGQLDALIGGRGNGARTEDREPVSSGPESKTGGFRGSAARQRLVRVTRLGAGVAPVEPESEHRHDIQGLRAVAVLLVALSHAGVSWLAGGFVGVDVFFVLSGFLITGLLLSEARRRRFVSLADFYLRRARRILPAATLTLLVTDFAAYHLLNFVRAKQYLQDSIPSALFAANIHFAAQGTDYFGRGQPPSPFQHFWSLAVEEQFYVVWPALFVLALGLAYRRHAHRPRVIEERAIRRVLITVVIVATASLVWSIYATRSQAAAAYFSTSARAWELAVGAALALGASRLARLPATWRPGLAWSGLGCIVIAAAAFSSGTPFPGFAALLPTVGAALVIAAGVALTGAAPVPNSAARVLSVPPLRFLGDRSYAFYLWHWPILVIAAQHAGHSLSVGTNLLLLLGAFGLSLVSYQWFEKPLRYARLTQKPEVVIVWAGGLLSAVVLATVYISSINGVEMTQRLQAQTVSAPALFVAAPPPHLPRRRAGGHRFATPPSVSQVLPAVIHEVKAESGRRGLPPALHPTVGQLLNDLPNLSPTCSAHDGQTASRVCRLGAPASSRTVVLIGDSHAEMWLPALLSLGQRDAWAVLPLIKSGCSPPMWTGRLGGGDCHDWFRWAVREAAVLHPEVAVVTGQYSHLGSGPDHLTIAGLDTAIRAMKRAAKHVVMLGDVPDRTRQPVDCLLSPHSTASGCADSLTPSEANITSVVAQLGQADRVSFIDPTGWFCYAASCPLVVGNVITYRDSNHVSQTYAAALSGVFREAFDAALRLSPRG